MKGKRRRPIREVALGLLTRRDYSGDELSRTLRARGFAEAEVEEEVARLRESGLVDERRTAQALVEQSMSSGRVGRALLRAKLSAKGIAPDLIDECLAALPGEWEKEKARMAASRWMVHRRREGAWREALVRYLRSRGFAWDAVRDALSSLGEDIEEVDSNDEP